MAEIEHWANARVGERTRAELLQDDSTQRVSLSALFTRSPSVSKLPFVCLALTQTTSCLCLRTSDAQHRGNHCMRAGAHVAQPRRAHRVDGLIPRHIWSCAVGGLPMLFDHRHDFRTCGTNIPVDHTSIHTPMPCVPCHCSMEPSHSHALSNSLSCTVGWNASRPSPPVHVVCLDTATHGMNTP
jgi:hypothetical protein